MGTPWADQVDSPAGSPGCMLRSLYISSKRASVSISLISDISPIESLTLTTYSLFPSTPRLVFGLLREAVKAESAPKGLRFGLE